MTSNINLLQNLAQKQKGGAEALKGFTYQSLFTLYKLLKEIDNSENNKTFQLEGVEDIDYYFGNNNIHYQVKCYSKGLDTEDIKKVLTNFLKIYTITPKSQFVIVHNNFINNGKAKDLQHKNYDLLYWESVLCKNIEKKSSVDIEDFLSKITFEKYTEKELENEINKLLIKKYNITKGNEGQYLNALFAHILFWSREKEVVDFGKLTAVIEGIRIDISKGVVNHAEKDKWLEFISFDTPHKENIIDNYFEGKAAKPYHIAAALPISRNKWENAINNSIKNYDVTIIQAASGQGKSTLLWQVAYHLRETYAIYELHYCKSQTDIGDLRDSIIARLKVGEVPLVVIDSLDYDVSAWSELAQRTQDLPIKYLIATRQEDWFRFNTSVSALNLKTIEIYLDYEEADKIFKAFAKREKLAPNVSKENAWENIKSKGLLIEFIYLITQGKMIKERLEEQIKMLHNEVDGTEKLEILRYVAVADVLGVTLYTEKLIDCIAQKIGFKKDRNLTISSLQKEYQIQFDSNTKIEGLHPVRSHHLIDVLHTSLPVVNTVKNVFDLIDTTQLLTFVSQTPLLLHSEEDNKNFLQYITKTITQKSYTDIVEAIHGVYAIDARKHWQENKEQYDFVYQKNIGLIYASDMIPFQRALFKPLLETDFMKENTEKALEIYQKFKVADTNRLYITWLIKNIHKQLYTKPFDFEIQGLAYLALWQHRYNLPCPVLNQIDVTKMLYLLQNEYSKEVAKLFFAIFTVYPDRYLDFYTKHSEILIKQLKSELEIIEFKIEEDNSISIKFFIDEENKIQDTNQQSVERLELIRYFMPQFTTYRAEGIYVPIPFLQKYRVIDDSRKNLSQENMINDFALTTNQVWLSTVSKTYTFVSLYDFQKYYFDLRCQTLVVFTDIIQFLYLMFENKGHKIKTNRVDNNLLIINELSKQDKDTPYDKIFTKERYETDVKILKKWQSNLKTVLHHLLPKDSDAWRLLNYNSQELLNSLIGMQNAYEVLLKNTQTYFDTSSLLEQESQTYRDFCNIVEYYNLNTQSNTLKTCVNIKNELAQWAFAQEQQRMQQVYAVLTSINSTKYEFILPSCSWKNINSRETTIGLVEKNFDRLRDAEELLLSLVPLAKTDIDKFYIVFVENNTVYNDGLKACFSISKGFLEKVYISLTENSDLELDYHRIFPMRANNDILKPLPNVSLVEVESSRPDLVSLTNILIAMWKYSKVRSSISQEEQNSPKWKSLMNGFLQTANHNLRLVLPQNKQAYTNIINLVVNKNMDMTDNIFQELLYEDIFYI